MIKRLFVGLAAAIAAHAAWPYYLVTSCSWQNTAINCMVLTTFLLSTRGKGPLPACFLDVATAAGHCNLKSMFELNDVPHNTTLGRHPSHVVQFTRCQGWRLTCFALFCCFLYKAIVHEPL